MTHRLLGLLLILLGLLLTGCATPTRMPFERDEEKLTETSKPVFLMTVTMRNTYRTSFQPRLMVVQTARPGAKEAADRFNFVVDEKARNETNTAEDGNAYFVRLSFDPGTYEIRGLVANGGTFPIAGMYFAPLYTSIEVGPPGVYYLGHVSATIRERQGSEFRAGPVVPLIDQAVVGASGGSFDIEISDRLAQDEAVFKSRFPALKDVEIRKALLPPFDRAAVQKRWDAE